MSSGRTTVILFVILALLGGYVFYTGRQQGDETEAASTPATENTETQTQLLPADLAMDDVVRLELRRSADNASAVYTHDGIQWTVVPTNTAVITNQLTTQVSAFLNLRSNRTLPTDDMPLSAYGLEPPQHEIVLALRNEEGRVVRHTFLVGNQAPTGNAYYVQRKGSSLIHLAPSGFITNIINFLDQPPPPVSATDG